MGSTRRSFTPEYKEQSVAFVIDGGRPVAEVARNIGVHEMTLGKWVKVARDAAESGKNPDAPPRPFQDHDVSPRMVNGRSMERPAHRVASVTSMRPARRSAPIARLRRAAMILGPDRVLTWDLSS